MAEQPVSHTLFRSATIVISDVHCRAGKSGCGGEEHSLTHSIAFPRQGVFVKHLGRRSLVADPNQVLFFNGHEPYRVSHPADRGDDCTVFAPASGVLADILRHGNACTADRVQAPFFVTHAPSEPTVCLRHLRLLHQLRAAALTELAVEETALGIIADTLTAAQRRQAQRPPRQRPDTFAAHRGIVDDAQTVLAERFRERWSLDAIARTVHCSPFHLSRLFTRLAGLPIHRYLNRLRLRAALEPLADTGTPLAQMALALGYSDQAHFSNAFRREFRLSPIEFRRCGTRGQRREMSKILQV